MTAVGDYLKKLLYQYDCLVVPELGAFLTHYLPASFSEATGQYLPPRKRLAFNEALRLDDGILINYIMLHESITRDGAMRQIAGYVSGIKQQLRASDSYTLDGIGLLTTNEEGKLQFHPELRHNFFAEAFGLQPIQAQYCESAEVSLPVLVLPAEGGQDLVAADSGEDGKLLPMPGRRSPWYWAAATVLLGSLAGLSYLSVIQPNQSLQSSLSPASLLRFPAFLPRATKPVTPAPAVEPVKAGEVNRAAAPETETTVPRPKPVALPVTKAPMPSVPTLKKPLVAGVPAAAPAVLAVAKKGFVAKRVPTPVSATLKPFLVVAGSFSSRSNALGLRRQLVKAGFDDAYLMMPVRRKELIKVAAFGAATLAEADSMMIKVKDITGVSAWLMRTR